MKLPAAKDAITENILTEPRELPELGPGQEVLFRPPADDESILGTIINRATEPRSYIVEAQGKQFHRTGEHIRPIHLTFPAPKLQNKKPLSQLSIPQCPAASLNQTQT